MNNHPSQKEATGSKEHPGRGAVVDLWKKDNSDATNSTASAFQSRLLGRTVKQKVLDYLMSGGALTQGDAWSRFGTSRLAAIVHVLRREGYPIRAETVAVECADGRVSHVACYSMEANHGTP